VLHISLARWSALALLVAQVSPATPGFGGTAWRLTHLGDKPVTSVNAKAAPTLLFDVKTSRFSGSGGCNRISGAYKHQGKALTFGAVVATKMACPGGIMNVEAELRRPSSKSGPGASRDEHCSCWTPTPACSHDSNRPPARATPASRRRLPTRCGKSRSPQGYNQDRSTSSYPTARS
jgi:heat shock protein HslJ